MLIHLSLLLALAAAQPCGPQEALRIHSVCDISQEFSFYMDGRFYTQYLDGVARDVRNWGSLHKLDLSNSNLLVLTAGDAHVPYKPEAITHVDEFVRGGGTLLLMADGAEPQPPGAVVAEHFGATLLAERAQAPLAIRSERIAAGSELSFRGGRTLDLGEDWETLLADAKGRPVLALRPREKGWVLLGSRGLFGQRPDASDPINAAWVRPLLLQLSSAKPIDTRRAPRSTWAELERAVGPLTLEYHEGTARFADVIGEVFNAVRPELVGVTGVEPSPGMIKRLLILPTGGGGFSSGERIAIGAWWGGFPEKRYGMVELIAHEAGHSWVLPYAEPLWNEPIATWLGISVGKRLGLVEAQATLDRQLAAGRRLDPEFDQLDPLADGAARDLVWGKSYFVFEELERLHGPGAMARYFRAKRALLKPGREGYSMDDCVAVWSRAVEQDLFPWFRSLAFDVSEERTELWP
jgi:hypothetical protein